MIAFTVLLCARRVFVCLATLSCQWAGGEEPARNKRGVLALALNQDVFLKSIWKGIPKHKKLNEEWILNKSHESELNFVKPVEGVTFKVKMLGNIEVALANSEIATAKAVQTIMNTMKAKKCKPKDVKVKISLEGISVSDTETDTPFLDISIYRISYCSADATHGNVFAFIATNREEGEGDQLECYAFMCPKRKMAQLVSITVAQSFNTAFHLWKLKRKNQENSKDTQQNKAIQINSDKKIEDNGLLIDLSPVNNANVKHFEPWAHFEDDGFL